MLYLLKCQAILFASTLLRWRFSWRTQHHTQFLIWWHIGFVVFDLVWCSCFVRVCAVRQCHLCVCGVCSVVHSVKVLLSFDLNVWTLRGVLWLQLAHLISCNLGQAPWALFMQRWSTLFLYFYSKVSLWSQVARGLTSCISNRVWISDWSQLSSMLSFHF